MRMVDDRFVMGRYYLPADARVRREAEGRLARLFASRGFEEIIPPILVGLGVAGMDPSGGWLGGNCSGANGLGRSGALGASGGGYGSSGGSGVSYAVLTRDGCLMTLRCDFTMPVAALAARHLLRSGETVRLFYSGSVFRAQKPGSGKQEEWRQVGVELMGSAADDGSDVELLSLAAESLLSLGVRDFSIGIGHAGLLEKVLRRAGAEGECLAEAWRALAGRDFVLFGKLTSGLDQGALCALRMPVEDGPVSSEPEAKALAQTMDALRERGLADCFRLDLTIARELDYYTGIVFEAYTRGAGNAVIGGGRYDTLLERFGASAPAAGFAIDMDSLVCAMGVQCDA